jgi:AraC-like DNA-binding protein
MRTFAESLPMTAAYFSLIVRADGRTDHERRALLDGTDVPAAPLRDSAIEITLGQQLRQIRNANRTLEPGWALAVGARLHPATHGPIGFAAVSAPSVARGIDVMTRFSEVRAPHFRLRADVGRREVRLVPEDRVELADEERTALQDIVLLSTQAMIEGALGRPMREGRIELAHPAPAHAARYGDWFHATTSFGHREAAVVIPAEWLALECPLADAVTFDDACRRLAAGARRLQDGHALAGRVEHLLAIRGDDLDATAIARLLRVSRRTLARRLREGGTTYRAIVDTARRQRAEALLRERRLDVAEIAYALGYGDTANFGRACRRWWGTSPGSHRRRMTGGDA